MFRVSDEDAAAFRARWLAELSDGLDAAYRILGEMPTDDYPVDARELRARVETAKREVLALRLRTSRGGGHRFGPEWTDNIPWKRSA